MHLTPREIDKLMLHQAGFLAQKRLARGLRLNYVEAMALIATQLMEFIRDGRSVAELMDLGRRLLGRNNVLDGVAEMIDEVQIEGTFPDGTKLVTVHHPIVADKGDADNYLELAVNSGRSDDALSLVGGQTHSGGASAAIVRYLTRDWGVKAGLSYSRATGEGHERSLSAALTRRW